MLCQQSSGSLRGITHCDGSVGQYLMICLVVVVVRLNAHVDGTSEKGLVRLSTALVFIWSDLSLQCLVHHTSCRRIKRHPSTTLHSSFVIRLSTIDSRLVHCANHSSWEALALVDTKTAPETSRLIQHGISSSQPPAQPR